ncbi:MAG: 4-hydroxy-tetrahydrodipicolinate reductase [Clostridium sp.]|jgi:4-hydroxy-tetrahydrodipicolinate reductase
MNVIVIGPKGKMGKLIVKVVSSRQDMKLLYAIGPKGRDYISKDLGNTYNLGESIATTIVDDLDKVIDECDVIIDYSNPSTSMKVLESSLKTKKAVVCGTTGFSVEQLDRIKEISTKIPIVYAANTSRVINLMYSLLEIAASAIGNAADIEIIEMHDRNKKDAPSGTSKEMGEVIAKALDKSLDEIAVYGRQGEDARVPGTIGYHSIRAGDISSSHTVLFGLQGERLEITHHAHNFECFAVGACEAASFIYGKDPGLYTVKDVMNL